MIILKGKYLGIIKLNILSWLDNDNYFDLLMYFIQDINDYYILDIIFRV